MDYANVLLTSSITSALYLVYKTIQHYRIHSTCNNNNQLVVEVVEIDTNNHQPQAPQEQASHLPQAPQTV